MWLRVLGSAAGGGSPQWNCGCPVCAAVRSGAAPPRTQSSVAVSVDRRRWFLINASPDVRAQIEACPELHPLDERTTPLESVLLTDAELMRRHRLELPYGFDPAALPRPGPVGNVTP